MDMKQFLAILSLLASTELQAQKIYAFTQRIVPGTRTTTMDKEGNLTVEKKKENWHQMVYLEIPKTKKLEMTELWVNGERYSFDTATVVSPVVEPGNATLPGHQDKVLIPKTENRLLLITPKENITETNNRRIAGRKKILIYYMKNGKTCHQSTDKITQLPEMLMQ